MVSLAESGWRQLFASARRCDVILASHNFRPAYVGWGLGRMLGKPTVVWFHGPVQEVLALSAASPLKRAWLRFFYARLKLMVFVSEQSRLSLRRFLGQQVRPGADLSVVANAVHTATIAPAAPREGRIDESSRVRLAFVGRLSAQKHPELLLEVLRRLPRKYELTLLGDGPLLSELQQLGQDLLQAGRLAFGGARPHGPDLYRGWDLTLMTSRYEGYPMSVLESISAGVPCVGVPIGPLREMLGDDAPYLLARDACAEAIAQTVLAVCAMPRRRLQADMERVLARHRMEDFVGRWERLLSSAAGR
ncbi:glycosyltransferase family 4 protein [Ramlibacter tataouinensis]|nr:glycosyltransferase family 4 protein [Ramlibacter tataouinensis]